MTAGRPFDESLLANPLRDGALEPPDAAFAIVEWAAPGGVTSAERPIAGLHVHHRDDEAWYVLEGQLGFRLGGRELIAPAGSAVHAPAGVAHSFWNAGEGPARYLLVLAPRLLALVRDLHAGSDEPFEAIFARYDSELIA